jgi:phosphatidylglycerophosphate synthase
VSAAQPTEVRSLALGLTATTLAVVVATLAPGAIHTGAAAAASVGLATVGAFLVWRLRAMLPAGVLALATRITIVRGGIAAWLAGLVVAPTVVQRNAWLVVGIALVELALDGIDGIVARRRNEVSEFGGVLDGETDALVVLALGGLAFRAAGDALLWPALAIGVTRYVFLLAVAAWPRLRGRVPSSWQAKVICDVQIAVLLGCLAPLGPTVAAWHASIAWGAFALLLYSFGRDVRYLLGRAR